MQQEHIIISLFVTNIPDELETEIRSCELFEKRTQEGYASPLIHSDGASDILATLMGILERAEAHRDLLKRVTDAGAEAVLYITHNSEGHHNLLFSQEILSRMAQCRLTLGVD